MTTLYIWNITDTFDYTSLLNQVPDKHSITRYRRESDQKLHLASYLLKKKIVQDEPIYKGEFGKPFADNIKFNISHDHACVVGATHHTSEIGVDVIYLDRRLNMDSMKGSFTASEWNYINNSKQTLLTLWTYKEAFIKMLGTGLQISPERIELSFDGSGILRQAKLDNIVQDCCFDVRQWDRYMICICLQQSSPFTVDVQML